MCQREERKGRRPVKKFQREERKGRRPGKCVRGRGGNGGGEKSCCNRKGGKHCSFIWRENYGVSWKSLRIIQVEYTFSCTPYNSLFFFISYLLSTGRKSGCQGGQGKCVRGRGGNGWADKICHFIKGGKHHSLSGEVIMESVGSPE